MAITTFIRLFSALNFALKLLLKLICKIDLKNIYIKLTIILLNRKKSAF